MSKNSPVHIHKLDNLFLRTARHQINRYLHRCTSCETVRSLSADLEDGRTRDAIVRKENLAIFTADDFAVCDRMSHSFELDASQLLQMRIIQLQLYDTWYRIDHGMPQTLGKRITGPIRSCFRSEERRVG